MKPLDIYFTFTLLVSLFLLMSNCWVINAQEVTFDPWALFSPSLTRRNAEKQSRISRHSTLYSYELFNSKDGAKGDTEVLLRRISSLDRRGGFGCEREKTSFELRSSSAVLAWPQIFLRAAANTESSELSLRFGWSWTLCFSCWTISSVFGRFEMNSSIVTLHQEKAGKSNCSFRILIKRWSVLVQSC